MSTDSATIDHPIAQMTCQMTKRYDKLNVAPNSTSVISTKTSHRPRVTRNRETAPRLMPRRVARYEPVPARNTNTGAQKCVAHRVKNSAAVVFVKSSGENSCDS